jgi:hypothetical protein
MASNNYIYKMSNAGGMSTITRYTDMLAGNTTWSPWEPAGAYESIATANGTGSSAVITFSSIPATYTHLQIRGIGRSTSTGTTISVRANSDTGSNYARHYFYGDGATAGAGANATQTSMQIAFTTANGDLANTYGANVIDILDYANTNKYKTFRVLTGVDVNGAGGYVQFSSGLWQSSTAITSITLTNSTNYTTATQFALYGIRGT